ncbi:hypothetical protein KGY79_05165 [Candidatus Bipolaricaulota bacterium]|nr:hypothetical protein [Candidatus Bipolaricaulota bacterium]
METSAILVQLLMYGFIGFAFYAGYKSMKDRQEQDKGLIDEGDLKILGYGLGILGGITFLVLFYFLVLA